VEVLRYLKKVIQGAKLPHNHEVEAIRACLACLYCRLGRRKPNRFVAQRGKLLLFSQQSILVRRYQHDDLPLNDHVSLQPLFT
jgi:hypothetical protein